VRLRICGPSPSSCRLYLEVLKTEWICATTAAPSPTAEATRFVEQRTAIASIGSSASMGR
jgi:hypothetical protein